MKIALVEDDPIQRKPVSSWLIEAGYTCHCFEDCSSYLGEDHANNRFDLLLLDWELPDESGLELLRQVREKSGETPPAIFLTRRDHEQDIVTALKSGADDYLVKPARRDELLARIEAVTRRHGSKRNSQTFEQVGPFEIDLHARQLSRDGAQLNLTQKEFSLAHYLLRNLGHLVTRQELLEKVWQQSANLNTRTVDTHISRLRRKLDLTPENGWQLTAIYQYGYRLDWLAGESA